MLRKELDYTPMDEVFWTMPEDFMYFGNRVQEIREQISPRQWRFVGTKSNPADIASHGAGAQETLQGPL